MAVWLTPGAQNWMCSWAFVDGSLAPDAISIIRGIQRKPGAQRRSSHLPAIGGPKGPDQRPRLASVTMSWPLQCLQGEGRRGGFYLCRPQGRSPETLSKPSPSPQYGGPIPKGVSLALLGLHLSLLFWNAPPTRCLPEACPSPGHQAWKMPREQARQLNKISKGNGQS